MLSTLNLFLTKELTSFQKFTDCTDCHKLIANNCPLIFFKFRTGYGIVQQCMLTIFLFLVQTICQQYCKNNDKIHDYHENFVISVLPLGSLVPIKAYASVFFPALPQTCYMERIY